jgi:hypothetical protein
MSTIKFQLQDVIQNLGLQFILFIDKCRRQLGRRPSHSFWDL